jgi:SAM-dependent methyltransferase
MDLFNSRDRIYKKTIKDFGSQWKIHGKIRDTHWASDEMFRDHFGSDSIPAALSGKRVCEIGSGSGRIIEMLRRYNPSHITGVEPSQNALFLSVKYQSEPMITILNEEGESFKAGLFDFFYTWSVASHK